MWILIGLLIFAGWRIYPHFSAFIQEPTNTPTQPIPYPNPTSP